MKMIIDYEVEGSWLPPGNRNRCRACGTLLEPVPEEGHFNSQYHILKQNDGCELYCCPKGCGVKEVTKEMRHYLDNQAWFKKGSESYKWKWDYKKILYAWITVKGKIRPCSFQDHIATRDAAGRRPVHVAYRDDQLEFSWDMKLTKPQVKTLMDFSIAYSVSFDKRSKEEIAVEEIGYAILKIG